MQGLHGCRVPIGLVPGLRALGISHAEVLAAAGLPSRLLDEEPLRLPMADYFALWSAIRTVSRDPSIGITLARSFSPDLTEPLFLAILSAASIDAAIDVVAAYKR